MENGETDGCAAHEASIVYLSDVRAHSCQEQE